MRGLGDFRPTVRPSPADHIRFLTGLPYLAIVLLGLSQSNVSVLTGAGLVLALLTPPLLNQLSRLRGARRTFQTGMLCFALAAVLFPVAYFVAVGPALVRGARAAGGFTIPWDRVRIR